ncbi:calcium-translocating P-type ATPase [Xylariomycetidae sp. FL2044]|nr:calcium-translocating P-type ATPase [Xylariomycetidae sp. FL2044]
MAGDSLAPPSLAVDTHVGRPRSDTNETRAVTPSGSFVSNASNPFLTPANTNPFVTPTPSVCGSSLTVVDPETALRPDPGTEADFQIENNPYAFSPGQLNKLLNPKNLLAFRALGGLAGIERGLQTDINAGLSVDETSARATVTFEQATRRESDKFPESSERPSAPGSDAFVDRSRVFGKNVLPSKKATPLWKLMWNAYNDKVIILLTVAAVISLALGLYETLGVQHGPDEPPSLDWVEGVAIVIAILIVTLVGSLNDWQKERAFVRLNAKKEDREIKVVRSGKSFMINVHDILVGDVLHLEPGDLVPVDGVFITGHDLKCDESSATGESDAIKKTPGEHTMAVLESGANPQGLDPFIISGAKVLEGVGTFLCTSVGEYSSFGKIMMSVRTEIEPTPLQKKLEKLAVAIAKLGGSAAILLFFILLFRFVAGLSSDTRPPAEKASTFLDILIVAVTIIVVAVPEGLPLAVTLALAFATTRLLKENNLVRVLRACETMGNATTICSDKTGTLTTNKMTVVAGTFGQSSFAKADSEKSAQTVSEWAKALPKDTKDALVQSVAINSTAFEGEENGQATFIGSKTETALLQLAKDHLGMQSLPEARANVQVVQMMPFDSGKKCMGAVIKHGSGFRLLVKGASEILLGHCSDKADGQTLSESELTPDESKHLTSVIEIYAKGSLRTIGLVYRDFAQWPPAHAEVEDDHVIFSSVLKDLVWLGVVGIQDPVRPGVPEAVRKAQHAGVTVRMVTGDNAVTAQAIATECGIYTDGVIMEGPAFRVLSNDDMKEVLPRLQVLARSSPEDKRILVAKLKSLGETVAVTGDGTNDAPALKTADVGFSMGVCGTEVAKEASEIVLMDDNFTSILTALKWGRAVNDSVQKFLQFQITVNITAVLLAFISAVASPDMHSVLTAVQLLWVNLIMDTFAALALATDPPTEKILDRPPQGKHASLITTNMWKMITGQAIYQLAVTLVLYFAGSSILGYDPGNETQQTELNTMVFNTFVWMQIFNEFNNRRLDNKFNIFEGVHRNKFFIVINCIMVGAQVAIVYVGGAAFEIKPIDGVQWAICIVAAALSLPWAVLIRLFPDAWFARIAAVVGGPVAVAYRFLAEVFGKIGRIVLRRKNKKSEGADGDEENSEEALATEKKVRHDDEERGGGADTNNTNINTNTTMPAIFISDGAGTGGSGSGSRRNSHQGDDEDEDTPRIRIEEDLERGRRFMM